ncbi:MAG: nickel-dependent lactate racemase [Desulfobacterales bacterium]|nr:nickel-dependent lactate racemase [Desulfobacterales bacterium]
MVPPCININSPHGFNAKLPRMSRVRVNFSGSRIKDIAAKVQAQVRRSEICSCIKPDMEIAVGCGSRGEANNALIAAILVNELKKSGARPFIFPAMGSHGASSAQGQIKVLASLGISEKTMGCLIKSTMETTCIGQMDDGIPIYLDKNACRADGVVLINRIKPHTTFRGPIESGIVKMMAIGMGKAKGADTLHAHGFGAFSKLLPKAAQFIMTKIPFLFGLATVENAYHETAIVKAIPAKSLIPEEIKLQSRAKQMMGSLLFDKIDVLILDEIGKNISGAGFDPNIVGRNNRFVEWDGPLVKKIVLLDLSAKTEGNAVGMGLADVITMDLFNKIDFDTTYTNVVSSNLLDGGAIPMIANTEQQAISMAAMTVEKVPSKQCKIVKMKNTLEVSEILVSESLWPQVRSHPDMAFVGEPFEFKFDNQGRLLATEQGARA